MRRKTGGYFKTFPADPPPLKASVKHRASFSEVDAMAVAWHGRYPRFFEMGHEHLCRQIGLSYKDFFAAAIMAPIVQLHTDYHQSVFLDEEVTITITLFWTDAARLNAEYAVIKENGELAATGYTVQMFTDGQTGEPFLVTPELLRACQEKWRRGEFKDLQ